MKVNPFPMGEGREGKGSPLHPVVVRKMSNRIDGSTKQRHSRKRRRPSASERINIVLLTHTHTQTDTLHAFWARARVGVYVWKLEALSVWFAHLVW